MATVNATLSVNLTANGDTDIVDCRGSVIFSGVGTFDSGTITPYLLDGAGNEVAMTDGALSADGTYLIAFPERSKNKVFGRLAGAGGSVDINVWFNSA